MSILDVQIKSTIEQLNDFKHILTHLCTTTGLGAFSKFGKAISRIIDAARGVSTLYWNAYMWSNLKQSWLENAITKMFSDSISIHISILSDSDVKPEDNVSGDICAFLKSQLDTMEVRPARIAMVLDYLVSYTTSIFI